MSQTFPGDSPPPIKQKSEQVPRYRLMFMCCYPFEYRIRCSKCWPFAATSRFHIKESLMRSSSPGRFLMASKVATMCSHNSSTLVTVWSKLIFNVAPKVEIDRIEIGGTRDHATGPLHPTHFPGKWSFRY